MWRPLILLLLLSHFIQAQNVGINATGNVPNASAMLDIESVDKGLLIPRISLTDIADVVTIPTPALSLLVYNTNAAITGGNGVGFYYFDGTNWIKLNDGSTANTNWSITGNAATVDGTNFIGTTDDVPFTIRVNNAQAGRITNTPANQTSLGYEAGVENRGTDNTAIGYKALRFNGGNRNTAIGSTALYYNRIPGVSASYPSNNTAVGYAALYNNTQGSSNTASGAFALYNNTTGYYNTSNGFYALYNNTSGNNNTSSGYNSLGYNTTGSDNTSNGYNSLRGNTIGNGNVAIGSNALLYNHDGSYNTGVGFQSLNVNYSGNGNTAIGYNSLYSNSAGTNNVATGYLAAALNQLGSSNNAYGYKSLYRCSGTGNGGYGEAANPTTETGWNNIGIGFHSLGQIDNVGLRILGNVVGYDNIALGLVAGDRIGSNCNQSAFIGPFTNVITNNTDVSNSTALGNGALVFQNNMMRLGNSAITRIETQVGLTVVSDGRYKFNVTEDVKGLAFIKKLRPVIYQYNTQLMDKEWMKSEFDTMVKHNPQLLKDYEKASTIRYSGFIAQEVELAAKESNYDFNGVSKPENTDGHYGLNYSEFVVPIVKSVQELQVIIDDQKQRIDKLESLVKELLKK